MTTLRPMTVTQLVEALRSMPQDCVVLVGDGEAMWPLHPAMLTREPGEVIIDLTAAPEAA